MLKFTLLPKENDGTNPGAVYGTVFSQVTDGRPATITSCSDKTDSSAIIFVMRSDDETKSKLLAAYDKIKHTLKYVPMVRKNSGLLYTCIYPDNKLIWATVLNMLDCKYTVIEDYREYLDFMKKIEEIF